MRAARARQLLAAAPGETHVLDQRADLGRAGALGRNQVVKVEAQRADLAAQLRARERWTWSASARLCGAKLRAAAQSWLPASAPRGRWQRIAPAGASARPALASVAWLSR